MRTPWALPFKVIFAPGTPWPAEVTWPLMVSGPEVAPELGFGEQLETTMLFPRPTKFATRLLVTLFRLAEAGENVGHPVGVTVYDPGLTVNE
jgi:hypothetical protein